MLRALTMALVLSSVAAASWAQSDPMPTTGAEPGKAAAKHVAKKPTAKAATNAKAIASAEGRHCQFGVIPAVGSQFAVQNVGLTVFGNALTEVPIETWGLEDLIVARVRAAAGSSTSVRRVTYAKDAFEAYYHPPRQLFGNSGDSLAAIVRQVAGSSDCERYLVVTESGGQYGGTNQTMNGLGVVTNWSSGAFKKGALYTYIHITVFDGHDFTRHKDPLDTVGARLAAGFVKDDSIKTLDNFEPPSPPDAAVNDARLRDTTRTLLTERLDKILPAYLNDAGESQ
jgi:hypothetical protein